MNKKDTKPKTVAKTTNVQPEEPELTPEEKWYNKILSNLDVVSQLKPSFFTSDKIYESLKSNLSTALLLDKLPKALKSDDTSIITYQFNYETNQWIELFNHYLTLTPNFLFRNAQKTEEYLIEETSRFLFFLYKPLQKQYDVLLQNIITYNYSPFKIDIKLFFN